MLANHPMESFPLFATLDNPDFNLLGAKSATFLCIFILLASVSFSWFPIPDTWRNRITLFRPVLTLLGFWSVNYLREYKHFEAQLDFSRIICLAFGMAFRLAAIRCPGYWPKIWAASILFLHLHAGAVYLVRFCY